MTDAPNPSCSALDAKIYAALEAFLVACIPGLTKDAVFSASAAPDAAPPAGKSRCLITTRSCTPTATAVVEWSEQEQAWTLRNPLQIELEADFRGEHAAAWAETLALLWRGQAAADWLAPYDCQPLYTDPVLNMTGENAQGQFEQRWTLTLYAAAASRFTTAFDGFKTIDFTAYPQL